MAYPPIILASTSPFRKTQLEKFKLSFTCISPTVDERKLENEFQDSLTKLSAHLAEEKCHSVSIENPEALVIGSDQVLLFENKTWSKPKSSKEAIERLTLLQGKTHELHTSIAIHWKGRHYIETIVSRMTMHTLTLQEIENYVNKDKPMGCAGGYKFEENGVLLFNKIETSDPTSIIGLPLLPMFSAFREWELPVL